MQEEYTVGMRLKLQQNFSAAFGCNISDVCNNFSGKLWKIDKKRNRILKHEISGEKYGNTHANFYVNFYCNFCRFSL